MTGAAAEGIAERDAPEASQGSTAPPVQGSAALPAQRSAAPARPGSRGTVIVSSMASDAHTWNLVFLQLLIEELGFDVVNLGATVPDEMLLAECREREPHLVVLSSVNGHGYHEGLRLIDTLRGDTALAGLPVVIGGKLGITGGESAEHIEDLLTAGFDAVFDDRPEAATAFVGLLGRLSGRQVHELR